MPVGEIAIGVGLVITVIGAIFTVYDRFTKPTINQTTEISLLKKENESTDNKIQLISERIKTIEENHLRHIEADINRIEKSQIRILTILEERYQIKADKENI